MSCVDGRTPVPGEWTDSGEAFQYECDPCKFEDTISEATGYCYHCSEYLCTQCQKYHRKFSVTREHIILDGGDMPTTQRSRVTKLSIRYCDHHVAELLEFYCKDHNGLLCMICKSMQHMNCNDVKRLEEVSRGARQGHEIHNVIDQMKSMYGQLEILKRIRMSDLESTKNGKAKCRKDISTMRKQLAQWLDKLETDLYEDLQQKDARETTVITEVIHTISSTMSHVTSTLKVAQGATELDDMAVFSAIRKSENLIHECDSFIAVIQQEAYTPNFKFQPDQEISDLMKKLTKLGINNFQKTHSAELHPLARAPTEADFAPFKYHKIKKKKTRTPLM